MEDDIIYIIMTMYVDLELCIYIYISQPEGHAVYIGYNMYYCNNVHLGTYTYYADVLLSQGALFTAEICSSKYNYI